MSLARTIEKINEEFEDISYVASELKLYDWDEIFESVPDGLSTKNEIVRLIERLSNAVDEIDCLM